MISVAALTSGHSVPSARFRVRQHIAPLRLEGFDVREFVPAIEKYAPIPEWLASLHFRFGVPSLLIEAAWRAAKKTVRLPGLVGSQTRMITWLERQLLPGFCTVERWLKRPIVFDVDDAIWLVSSSGAEAARKTAGRAAVVIAGNEYIADWFSAYSGDVRIVPTAVNTLLFRPRARPGAERERAFVIGWTGTSSNLGYLEAIEAPIRRFMADHLDSQLLVMSDRPPHFAKLDSTRVRYERWTESREVGVIQQMDVGLMPLPDNEWTRGKCALKMLLYMACAIPTVVSPVGMNSRIIEQCDAGLPSVTEDDWYERLKYLHDDKSRACRLGEVGREFVERQFSLRVITERLAEIFREIT